MGYHLSLFVTALCFFIFWGAYWFLVVNKTHWQGKLPRHKPTMFDVRRLLREGHKDEAIRLYARIFKAPLDQARKDVEELERSLNV